MKEHNLSFDTEYILRDKNGKIKKEWTQERQKNDWVKGSITTQILGQKKKITRPFKSFIRPFITGGSDISASNIRSSVFCCGGYEDFSSYGLAGAGNSDNKYNGMRVGSDSTANSTGTYKLGALINSSTSGLYYGAHTLEQDTTKVGNYFQFAISRTFENKSSSDIAINEVEWYPACKNDVNKGSWTRDIISKTVAPGQTLKITITLKFPNSSSAGFTKFFVDYIQQIMLRSTKTHKSTNGLDYILQNTFKLPYMTCGQAYTTDYPGGASAAESEDSYGLQIGTSDAAVTENDYKLTQITESTFHHGTSGQNTDGTLVIPYVSGSSYVMEISRTFTNTSGASVTVKEAAMTCNGNFQNFINETTNPNARFMFYRWLTGDVVVGNGESLTVKIKPKVTMA